MSNSRNYAHSEDVAWQWLEIPGTEVMLRKRLLAQLWAVDGALVADLAEHPTAQVEIEFSADHGWLLGKIAYTVTCTVTDRGDDDVPVKWADGGPQGVEKFADEIKAKLFDR